MGVADEKEDDPLTPLLLLLPDRIEQIKLTSLDVQRRFKVLQACAMLATLLDDDLDEGDSEEEEEEEEEEEDLRPHKPHK